MDRKSWRLKLRTAKTTTTAFHLNNRDTHRQLDVVVNGAPLPNNNNPVYLGVTLDRSLTYKKHLKSLQSKVNARNGLLRCLAGSSWGAYTSTLRTGALALVYSAAEYASPAWCSSTHTRKLDVALNDTMRIITGCMRLTETTFLPVLAGITPPDIRRDARVAEIAATAKNNSDHLLHHKVTAADAACPQRLVSRRPFSRHAARLSNDNYDPANAWSDRVDSGPPLIQTACPQPRPVLPPGADLHRKQWVKLNRLRCGTARVGDTLKLWGAQESATCACGHITQTVHHVVVDCMIHKAHDGFAGLRCPDTATRYWLNIEI